MTGLATLDVDARGVAALTLNRPDKLNALNTALISDFNAVAEQAANDSAVRVIVLSGEGRAFCAGADIGYLKQVGELSYDDNAADARRYAAMAETLRTAAKPVLAKVHGAAYGGGVALAAACDIVVAARSAKFAITEARFGFTPSLMVPYLIGRIGQRGCRRWCLTGETMDAGEARRIGLADIVVDDGALDPEVERLVDQLLMNAPGGLSGSKATIAEVTWPRLDGPVLELAFSAFVDGRASPQAADGAAAFLEKRPPRWARETDG